MKKKILVIEDEVRMNNLIKDFLLRENFQVTQAYDGEVGLDYIIEDPTIDLIILDVMLPEIDGWSLLREVKKIDKHLPVLMLTARSQAEDELFGFTLGADDYVTKPFNMKILIARIHALLNRNNTLEDDSFIDYQWIKQDKLSHQFILDNEKLELTPNEYNLLEYLLENKNIALTREKILNHVWGFDYFGDIRTIDTHIKRLRKKIEPYHDKIKTVRGIGYTIEVD
jgi:DNA-binding response OmpR family regulator